MSPIRTVALSALVMTLGVTSGANAQSSGRLLDVPYVSQSADLCGAAALAMVRRYWGVPASTGDFAHLVDRSPGGIRTSRLAEAASAPGWRALPLVASGADDAAVAAQIDRGQPVIALILDRPGVFHYVVIVGWTGRDVIFHDPARQPMMQLPVAEFDEKWQPADRWMLAVVPAGRPAAPEGGHLAPPAPGAMPDLCLAALSEASTRAAGNRLDAAGRTLAAAIPECPRVAALRRELAGVAFRQADWPRAEARALEAVSLDAGDADAWRIAGAARYMQGDLSGSLTAFNRAGEPAIDRVLVDNAGRTPDPVIVRSTGLEAGQLLTTRDFDRAARRLAAVPAADRTDLRFVPATGSTMDVQAAVAERGRAPSGWLPWSLMGASALVYERVSIDLAGLAGSGETWHAGWRWQEHRPLVEFALATPSPGPLPGVVTVSGIWEEQTFATNPLPATVARSRASVTLSDWATGSVAWRAGLALDSIDRSRHIAVSGLVDHRSFDDRVSTSASIESWEPTDGHRDRFGRGDLVVAFRSSQGASPAILGRVGAALATADAPPIVWPTAGTGQSRTAPLRAHALHDDGIVTGDGFGRRLFFASIEVSRPIPQITAAKTSWAVFADAARVAGRMGRDPVVLVDVGAGLRLDVPGFAGTVLVDVGYGIVDGRVRVSAAIRPPWPGR